MHHDLKPLAIVIAIWWTLTSFADDATPPFSVHAALPSTTVVSGRPFTIATAVQNMTKQDQILGVWSCSYAQQWSADNPVIRLITADCKKNDIVEITLKPGEKYQRELSSVVTGGSKRAIRFHLKFIPAGERTKVPTAVLSNTLSVNVRP